jgi:DNA-binding NarL/FixJ family response regulator
LNYRWIEALAEITGRKCSNDEQLLIFTELSSHFDKKNVSPDDFIERSRRQIGLSPRLNDVLNCLLDSLSNKEIAEKLNISHHTVADYAKQVLAHYMVSSRRELLSAIKNGRLLRKKSTLTSESPEEQLFHILSDMIPMDINVCERRRYFFDHFMKLLNATSYIWYESEFDSTMAAPKALNILTNFSPEQQQLFFAGANETKLTDPYMVPSVTYHLTHNVSSYLRSECLDDDTWYNSEYTQKYHKNINIDHPLCYTISQGDNLNCGILVFREWQGTPFNEEERDFMDNVFSRLPWLFLKEQQINKSLFADLTAHQHKVLLFLIDGYGKKELAEHLHISENTANDHIKKIYKIFQVKSYGELMKIFIH